MEREPIRERVRSGLAAARARGRRLERPPRAIEGERIAELRAQGLSWRRVAAKLRVGVGTAHRMAQDLSEETCP
jgi:putative DNA-invertase from lambdoid prophage Rac